MQYTIGVRSLCEFTAKSGDLDLRFTPAPSAEEGMAGHRTVAERRGANYQTELPLRGEYLHLRVHGRADGYDPDRLRLEEVKTYRGAFERLPEQHRRLHWAQLKIYGWLLCRERDLPALDLTLVYFNIDSARETALTEHWSALALREHFEAQCRRFLAFADRELRHREARDQALAALRFPFGELRSGQRQLAEAVYKAASTGVCLLAQAPTGTGKTLGTLFPLLKAAPAQRLDRIFFLTAKTPGRELALNALEQLRDGAPELPLRTLEITARDKVCVHPQLACHGESCPLARGFYERLPAARAAALAHQRIDQGALRELAREHDVCPYYLGQELARWCDVVVADYNYFFDVHALLFGLSRADEWRIGVLVDEAHNLVGRARSMYSATLERASLERAQRAAPAALAAPLRRLRRKWGELVRAQDEDYRAYPAPPEHWSGALQPAIAAIAEYSAEHPTALDPALQEFHFDMLHFCRLLDSFGEHSLFDISKGGGRRNADSTLCLRNVVPAPFLRPRLAAAHTAVLFSATLSPAHFFGDLVGLPAGSPWIDVESPFAAEQLQVAVAPLSTRFQHREQSLEPIAQLIADQFYAEPGHYLAYFSSFQYLEAVVEVFAQRYPFVPIWTQQPAMGERARADFLERFTPGGNGIGFAVLGGAFGEGIDLPGDRLIGAFIATLGLPRFDPVNEQFRRRMDALFGRGYEYTYLYPGLQKCIQAAGRVIRTRSDRGTVFLIDDRFARRDVLALLPAWWRVRIGQGRPAPRGGGMA